MPIDEGAHDAGTQKDAAGGDFTRPTPSPGSALSHSRTALVRHSVVAAPLVAALVIIVVGGYGRHWAWTGYRTGDKGTPLTLWDWLSASLFPLTLALMPAWLGSRAGHRRVWAGAALVLTGVLLVLLVGGYVRGWRWTGFTGNTLWDWVKLFLVPFLLPSAFHLLAADPDRNRPDSTAAVERPPGRATVRSPAGPADRIATLTGAVAFAACLVVAVGLLVTGRPAAASGSAVSRTAWITVDSRSPGWTDTHIRVQRGSRLTVEAFGQVLPSHKTGYHWVSPDGLATHHRGQRSIVDNIPHAALIATIAEHPPAPLSDSSDLRVIDVGASMNLVVHTSGELYFGMNDEKSTDNDGWYSARIHAGPTGAER
jgi:hypothetical protein